MPSIGYLQVHAYASFAQIPIKDVAIVITAPDRTAIAMRITDRSGLIDLIEIPVPEREESLEPGADATPFATVTLYAYKDGYEMIISEKIQVFAETTTYQDLEMVPLPEYGSPEAIIRYNNPPQDL